MTCTLDRDSQRLDVFPRQPRRALVRFDQDHFPRPAAGASMPMAPVPEYKSTNSESFTAGPSTLNKVSRSRSLVGRRRSLPGPFSLRLR